MKSVGRPSNNEDMPDVSEEDYCEQLMLPCPSPCVRHCGIDESLICSGCFRTGREIANWPKMTDQERWDLIAELGKRRPLN